MYCLSSDLPGWDQRLYRSCFDCAHGGYFIRPTVNRELVRHTKMMMVTLSWWTHPKLGDVKSMSNRRPYSDYKTLLSIKICSSSLSSIAFSSTTLFEYVFKPSRSILQASCDWRTAYRRSTCYLWWLTYHRSRQSFSQGRLSYEDPHPQVENLSKTFIGTESVIQVQNLPCVSVCATLTAIAILQPSKLAHRMFVDGLDTSLTLTVLLESSGLG